MRHTRRRAEQEIPSARPESRPSVGGAAGVVPQAKRKRKPIRLRRQLNAIPLLRRSDRPSFATEADALGQGSGLVQFAMGWPGAPAAPLTTFP